MDDYDDSVMVALLPTTDSWCHIPLPHLTLVYAGEIPDIPKTTYNELLKAAAMISMTNNPITLVSIGTDIFGGGDEDEVDVIRLHESDALKAMQRSLHFWNRSKHKFNPHVTVGPVGSLSHIPETITFDRIMIGWGTSHTIYTLNSL